MKPVSIYEELRGNSYPGRGIVIGKSGDGKCAVTAYFIMGRSVNSRNRVFVEEGDNMRTQAFDPALLSDPSLVIYFPVRMFDGGMIVTNGDQTDTIYDRIQKHPDCAAPGCFLSGALSFTDGAALQAEMLLQGCQSFLGAPMSPAMMIMD